MKKNLVLSGVLIFLSAIISAGEFKPSLHTAPSVRQQGFGGFYSTDLDNFYGIYANPAILGLHAKHSLFPSIDVRAAGLLKDSVNIINAVSNKDMEKLGNFRVLSMILDRSPDIRSVYPDALPIVAVIPSAKSMM